LNPLKCSEKYGVFSANFPEHVVQQLPDSLDTGIYFGWACVDNEDVYKMVMSIGWNPYYQNNTRSMVR
jgi:riboflavin kinase